MTLYVVDPRACDLGTGVLTRFSSHALLTTSTLTPNFPAVSPTDFPPFTYRAICFRRSRRSSCDIVSVVSFLAMSLSCRNVGESINTRYQEGESTGRTREKKIGIFSVPLCPARTRSRYHRLRRLGFPGNGRLLEQIPGSIVTNDEFGVCRNGATSRSKWRQVITRLKA